MSWYQEKVYPLIPYLSVSIIIIFHYFSLPCLVVEVESCLAQLLFPGFYRASYAVCGVCYGPVSDCVCVYLSVYQLQVEVLLKLLNIRMHKQRYTIAHRL